MHIAQTSGTKQISLSQKLTTLLFFALLLHGLPISARDVTFYHISDQHYNIDEKAPAAEQQKTTEAEIIFAETIKAMNTLPGTPYPEKIGGSVKPPRGVILTGDLVNDANPDEMERWISQWGLTGKDGLIAYPVYEGTGNHDGGDVIRKMVIERNQRRPGVTNTSECGFHYSWDWDDVHFVQLNEYAGLEDEQRYGGNQGYGRKKQNYGNPARKSLQFLRQDLASQVGDSKRPIVLLQHYGFDGFALHPWGNESAWWTEEHALRLWEAIEGYNVISILCGHDGSEAIINWNGIPNRHMDDPVRFGVYHIGENTMKVGHRNSKSQRWEYAEEQPLMVDASLPPSLIQGPYLLCNHGPSTMTVLWRTEKNVTCKLRWGYDRFMYEAGQVEVNPYDTDLNLYQHTITNLKPNACVTYTLEIDGKYAPGMFYAPPVGADKVKFLIAGDQKNRENRIAMHKTFYDQIYQDAAYHSILLLPGDLVSEPSKLRTWEAEFFSRSPDERHARWMQSRMPLLIPQDNSPTRTRLFPSDPAAHATGGGYTLDYGPVTFFVLNGEQGLNADSEQHRWLRGALSDTTARWRVALYNCPADQQQARSFMERFQSMTAAHRFNLCILGRADSNSMQREGTTYLAPGARSVAVAIEGDTMTCKMFEPTGQPAETLTLK